MDIPTIWQSIRMLIWMTILTGLLYPVLITSISQFAFPEQARGSLLFIDDQPRGSILIAQPFKHPQYFWPRPSAIDFNPLLSGGSQLGPTSRQLKELVEKRRRFLLSASQKDSHSIPPDLLFASASGLDPHISPQAAYFQMERVAAARSISVEQLQTWVENFMEKPTLRVLGTYRINVLKLNHYLDIQSFEDKKHE